MIDTLDLVGEWTVTSENIVTREKKIYKIKNIITQNYYNLVHRFFSTDQGLSVNVDDMNITHLGMGLGITPATRNDNKLENEQERLGVAVKTLNTDFQLKFLLDSFQGNLTGGFITELGIFCKGTGVANSGTMISRAIVNIEKNENLRLTLVWNFRGKNV